MKQLRALWEITWYNTDRSLKVGERSVFRFCGPEVGLRPDYDLWFETNDICGEDAVDDFRRATVESIEHPKFGALDEVDTSKTFSYTFRFRDGRWVTIDVEQSQGVVEAASPDFAIDRSDPGWSRYQGHAKTWDRYPDWDLEVVLSDVVVSSFDEMLAEDDARRARRRQAR
jgi:hypothetical protein